MIFEYISASFIPPIIVLNSNGFLGQKYGLNVIYNWICMQKSYDYVLKFVIVGSSSVGKSSILRRFADDEFEESYISTIGIDFRFKYAWQDAGRCTSRTTT